MIVTLFLGLVVGMRHALEADHVAAVATLATRSASLRERVALATTWGLGHATTLVLFGGTALAFGVPLPDRVARTLEGVVGLMLIALGLDVLRRLRRRGVHFHRHRHGDGREHLHAHAHGPAAAHAGRTHEHEHARGLLPRALLVGTMHGLAGSAALVVLSLELTTSTAQALLYLGSFGLGSIAGMTALSLAISLPLRMASERFDAAWRLGEAALGMLTVALGCWMAALLLTT